MGNNYSGLGECPYKDMILDYLCDELELYRREEFEAHIEFCYHCKEALKSDKRYIDLIKDMPEGKCSDNLSDHVLDYISDEEYAALAKIEAKQIKRNKRFRTTFIISIILILIRFIAGPIIKSNMKDINSYVRAPNYIGAREVDTSNKLIKEGVNWLASVQDDNGGWNAYLWGGNSKYNVGLTSLALLAIVRGGDENYIKYENNIQRGVEYLFRQQNYDGSFGPNIDSMLYNHGIATVALIEIYKKSKTDELKEAITRAIYFICYSQHPEGGWGYLKKKNNTANSSITFWQLEALKLACAEGLLPGKDALNKGREWLALMMDNNGYIRYSDKDEFPNGAGTLTAMGAYSLPGDKLGEENLLKLKGALKKIVSDTSYKRGYYGLFFLTLAISIYDEVGQKEVFQEIYSNLVDSKDISFPLGGSWKLIDQWSLVGGRVYTTAMATLSMEVLDNNIKR